MAYALLINAVAAAPIVVKAAPRIVALVSKASGKVFTTVEEVWVWAKSSNGAAVATLSAIAAAGVSMVDLMLDSGVVKSFRAAKSDTADEVVKALRAGTAVYDRLSKRAMDVIDHDSELKYNLGDFADAREAKRIIQWAGPKFGNTPDTVVAHHTMLRAFLELDTQTVTELSELHLPV